MAILKDNGGSMGKPVLCNQLQPARKGWRQFYAIDFRGKDGTWSRHCRLTSLSVQPWGLKELQKMQGAAHDVTAGLVVSDMEYLSLAEAQHEALTMTGTPAYRILLVTEQVVG